MELLQGSTMILVIIGDHWHTNKKYSGWREVHMSISNYEGGLGSYLTQEEQELLAADRKIIIARTLALQVALLELYGATESHIQDGVANMRTKFQDIPTDGIKKIQESLGAQAAVLMDHQVLRHAIIVPSEAHPSLSIVDPLELPNNVTPIEAEMTVANDDLAEPLETPLVTTEQEPDQPDETQNDTPEETQADVREIVEEPQVEAPLVTEIPSAIEWRKIEGESLPLKSFLGALLDEHQLEQVFRFDQAQSARFFGMLKSLLEARTSKQSFVPKQLVRIRNALNGASYDEIAAFEGVGKSVVYQSLHVSLPKFFAKHKDEILQSLRDVVGETQEAIVAPSIIQPKVSEQEKSDKPEVTAVEEPLVDIAKDIFKTDNPEALKGIGDLFSLNNGVIQASSESVEAAKYLASLLRQRNINLEMKISDQVGRSVIVRLLEGVKNAETGERKYSTLSQIISDTPESLRVMKIGKTLASLRKIGGWLEGAVPAPAQKSEREHNADQLREQLPAYLGLSEEIVGQVLDRALGRQGDFSAELAKALLITHQNALQSGPDEKQIRILQLFSRPRSDAEPMTIAEVREELAKPGKDTMRVEEGWVSGMILRAYKKIITQRNDG